MVAHDFGIPYNTSSAFDPLKIDIVLRCSLSNFEIVFSEFEIIVSNFEIIVSKFESIASKF